MTSSEGMDPWEGSPTAGKWARSVWLERVASVISWRSRSAVNRRVAQHGSGAGTDAEPVGPDVDDGTPSMADGGGASDRQLSALRAELAATRAALAATRRLFHEVPAYVSVHEGPEHRIAFASGLLESLFGGPRLVDVDFHEGVPPELQAELWDRLDAVYRSGCPSIRREVSWSVRNRDTGVVAELCSDEVIQPWLAADGSVRGVMRFAIDVMAQVKARRALHASEQRLRTVVERAPVGIALLSVDLAWQRLNGELCHILKARPAQLFARDFRGIFLAEDWSHLERALRKLQRGEIEHVHSEERIVRLDGSLVWCSLSASLLDPTGNDDQLVIILGDISERNEYRRKLEQEARRRDEFMAMLGHELRNPLAALTNAAELLRRGGVDGQLTRVAGVLERQTRQMRHMVDDLLDVARITEGKIKLELELLDLAELVRGAAEDQRAVVASKGLSLRTEVPEGPVWVRADHVRMMQVIQNLVDNAAKFTDAPGEILLRVGDVEGEPGFVQLSVVDTGCGMDEDLQRHAFEPFRQGDRTLGRSRGGLGLGLPLVRGLVEMQGGRVQALSRGEGTGTHIRAILPYARDEAPRELHRDPSANRRVHRVLIVEDHQDSADTLFELLRQLGYDVRVAYDAISALSCMESFSPEMVLCDIGLPGKVSGYDVAREVRVRWGKHVCLVALTGYGSVGDQERALAAGFDVHMRKPLDLALFEELTARWGATGSQNR